MDSKTVLLAEDDPAHAVLLERALDRIGANCRLDVVADGKQMIEYLFGSGDESGRPARAMPELILLDLKMPQMSGIEVLSAMHAMREKHGLRYPPIVVLSSSREEAEIMEAYRLGAQSFIPKPTDFLELVEAIRQVLRYWIGLNESPTLPRRGVQSGLLSA